MVSLDGGGLQTKSMTSQRYRAAHKMADMRYYSNVMTTTKWRLQDGGYMLLWKRYGNNKMAAMCCYGNFIPTFSTSSTVQS